MRSKKTYAFAVDFEQEDDGSWSVDIPTLGVCAATGYTREEALEAFARLNTGLLRSIVGGQRPVAGRH